MYRTFVAYESLHQTNDLLLIGSAQTFAAAASRNNGAGSLRSDYVNSPLVIRTFSGTKISQVSVSLPLPEFPIEC